MSQKLSTIEHNRDIAGLKYLYPVLSRRAGGVSIGINLNTNNACNWRCIYCQVPDLKRGAAPEIDFSVLESELRFFLNQVSSGRFYEQFEVPEQYRKIKDIAISGNGEPTSTKEFERVIRLIGTIATEMKVLPHCKFVLITNGSLMHQMQVQTGLNVLNEYRGEVWFKLDSATESGRKKLNDTLQSEQKTLTNLKTSSALCATSLQTCMMQFMTEDEIIREQQAYLQLLRTAQQQKINLKTIMLYTIARPSLQPEADCLKRSEESQMRQFADQITALGYEVSVSL